jgi:hypothetical protein
VAPFDTAPAYEPPYAYEPASAYEPGYEPAPAFEPTAAYEPSTSYDPSPVYDSGARASATTTAGQDWRAELGDLPDLDAIANMAPKRRRAEAEDATTPPPPALDEADEGEEPLNRGLLLKFLSSVRN